ncbi:MULTISPECIES: post-transcriptional regulator [Gracilibacillus]|uniref:post-transcriptional regulator n=1 Tax=Gracilibacillus TaxID=74385 RepID=UPI0008248565|nr:MULTISPECIES: post-transcriptional regulator [Gracilibacillus]
MTKKAVSAWKSELDPVLESKVEEFKLLDYSKISTEDIWQCLLAKVWKGDPEKSLNAVVQDIMHLRSSMYMTFLTQRTWEDTNLQESLDAVLGRTDA